MHRETGVAASTMDRAVFDEGLRQYMLRVYNLMALGLGLSGVVAAAVAFTPLQAMFYTTGEGGQLTFSTLGILAMLSPLLMLFYLMFAMSRGMTAGSLTTFYWVFTALMGIGLSAPMIVYTGDSVVRAFFITGGAFAGLSLWGYTTKRDLGPVGIVCGMALWGLIIASLISIFFPGSISATLISVAGVIIFAGLTAYDTQAIKESYSEHMDEDGKQTSAVFGALHLYLDFINLFQFILNLTGSRD